MRQQELCDCHTISCQQAAPPLLNGKHVLATTTCTTNQQVILSLDRLPHHLSVCCPTISQRVAQCNSMQLTIQSQLEVCLLTAKCNRTCSATVKTKSLKRDDAFKSPQTIIVQTRQTPRPPYPTTATQAHSRTSRRTGRTLYLKHLVAVSDCKPHSMISKPNSTSSLQTEPLQRVSSGIDGLTALRANNPTHLTLTHTSSHTEHSHTQHSTTSFSV